VISWLPTNKGSPNNLIVMYEVVQKKTFLLFLLIQNTFYYNDNCKLTSASCKMASLQIKSKRQSYMQTLICIKY
jgi:hypothetical protein